MRGSLLVLLLLQAGHSLKQGVGVAALHAVWALALAGVGADAAAVVVALRVPPAGALVVVGVRARPPCSRTTRSSTRQLLCCEQAERVGGHWAVVRAGGCGCIGTACSVCV